MDVSWLPIVLWVGHALAPRKQNDYTPQLSGQDEPVDLLVKKATFWADYIVPTTQDFSLLKAAQAVDWKLSGPYTRKEQEFFTVPPLYQALLPRGTTFQQNLPCFILHYMMPGFFNPDAQGMTRIYGTRSTPELTFDRSLRLVSLSDNRAFDGDWDSAVFLDSLQAAMGAYVGGYHNQHHVAQYTFLKAIGECGDVAVQAFWKPFTYEAKENECINCKFGLYNASGNANPDALRRLPTEWAQRIKRARELSHLPYHHHLARLYDTCHEWCARTRVPLVSLSSFDIPRGYCVHSLFLVNFFLFVHGDIHHLDFHTAEVPFPRFIIGTDSFLQLVANRIAYTGTNTALRFSQYLEMSRDPHQGLWLEHDQCIREAPVLPGFIYRGALTTMMPSYFTV